MAEVRDENMIKDIINYPRLFLAFVDTRRYLLSKKKYEQITKNLQEMIAELEKSQQYKEEKKAMTKKRFFKIRPNDTIRWEYKEKRVGYKKEYFFGFTFDRKKVYDFIRDYPDSLTEEERTIFEKECPAFVTMHQEMSYPREKKLAMNRCFKGEERGITGCGEEFDAFGFYWFTEQFWIKPSHSEKSDYVYRLKDYILAGLEDFNKDDGTPLTLKVLFYHRFANWGMRAPEFFKKRYIKEYLNAPYDQIKKIDTGKRTEIIFPTNTPIKEEESFYPECKLSEEEDNE